MTFIFTLLNNQVGDFGLSRVTAENRYYYKRDGSGDTPLPEYMYPPETLGSSEKKFYPEGDVWSFGQLLYEVFNQKFSKYFDFYRLIDFYFIVIFFKLKQGISFRISPGT
jgi:serine/threonine protein kinase